MEAMFETARDREEYDVDLVCPQCRGSIAEMQHQSRVSRITSVDGMGCSREVANDIIAFENLLLEVVHACECEPDGRPYFMKAPGTVMRVMARDEICDVVGRKMGHSMDTRLRRMLRAEDFGGVVALVLQGFAELLRCEARRHHSNREVHAAAVRRLPLFPMCRLLQAQVPSVVVFLEMIERDLHNMAGDMSRPHRGARLASILPAVERAVASERALEEASSSFLPKRAPSTGVARGRSRGANTIRKPKRSR